VPEEPIARNYRNKDLRNGRVTGSNQWGQLFNPRQLLALVTFGKWVRAAHGEILRQTSDPDFARAVATYLALAVDFMANRNSVLGLGLLIGKIPEASLQDTTCIWFGTTQSQTL
jgi:adenine-specific DNA methylase